MQTSGRFAAPAVFHFILTAAGLPARPAAIAFVSPGRYFFRRSPARFAPGRPALVLSFLSM